jgi:hypothetical protein
MLLPAALLASFSSCISELCVVPLHLQQIAGMCGCGMNQQEYFLPLVGAIPVQGYEDFAISLQGPDAASCHNAAWRCRA